MKLGEFDFIRRVQEKSRGSHPLLRLGIGDDAAILAGPNGYDYVVSTDLAVEGIHFSLKWMDYSTIGLRAVHAALSDIAAMGGDPLFTWVSVAFPHATADEDKLSLMDGVAQALSAAGAVLVGGDTSSSSTSLTLDVVVMGQVLSGKALLRSSARPGDLLVVSGTLGDAALGLHQLKDECTSDTFFARRHRCPQPRLLLGKVLAKTPGIHAMMDVSDGLVQDLSHMMRASNTYAILQADQLPLADGFATSCATQRLNPLQLALSGGEDYELVFTGSSAALHAVSDDVAHATPVNPIGRVVNESEWRQQISHLNRDDASRVMVLDSSGKPLDIDFPGFDHFRGV